MSEKNKVLLSGEGSDNFLNNVQNIKKKRKEKKNHKFLSCNAFTWQWLRPVPQVTFRLECNLWNLSYDTEGETLDE